MTAEAPATVKEFRIAVPETVSLNVKTMVFSAVLFAVNVGGTLSSAFAFVPSATSPPDPVTSPVAAT